MTMGGHTDPKMSAASNNAQNAQNRGNEDGQNKQTFVTGGFFIGAFRAKLRGQKERDVGWLAAAHGLMAAFPTKRTFGTNVRIVDGGAVGTIGAPPFVFFSSVWAVHPG